MTSISLDLDVAANGNPGYTTFAIRCAAPADPAWDGRYVDAAGNPSAAAVWRTDADWGTTTVQGLAAGTEYCFRVTALNGDGYESYESDASCATTQSGPSACPGDCNCDGQVTFADINGFVDAVTNQIFCDGTGANADLTQDDPIHVGFEDINPFVELLLTSTLPLQCP